MAQPDPSQPQQQAPHELRPAWSLPAGATRTRSSFRSSGPARSRASGRWGGSTGKGVRVCILDSGVDEDHPLVGVVQQSVAVSSARTTSRDRRGRHRGRPLWPRHRVRRDRPRRSRPDCELDQRPGARRRLHGQRRRAPRRPALGGGAGLRRREHEPVDDEAAVRRDPPRARPTRRTSGARCSSRRRTTCRSRATRGASPRSSRSGATRSPTRCAFYYNPDPPVEFFARGVDVEVAWTGGARIRCTGNSFATPHMSALCALVLGKHPDLTPFQLKSVLYLTSSNVGGGR